MTCQDESLFPTSHKQRLWNDPCHAVKESLLGMAMLHEGLVVLDGCNAVLRRDYNNMTDKVKLISGGGAGNEPSHIGFVGPGMLTAAICGNLSASPSAESILKVIEEIATNYAPGVLMIVQNYTGYRINFALAKFRAHTKGIYVKMVVIGEDVCLQSYKHTTGKRGLSATLFIHKIAGAMAEKGKSLESIYNVCKRIAISGEIATIGIGHSSLIPTIPNYSASIFACSDAHPICDLRIGCGIHGEAGASRMNVKRARDVAQVVVHTLVFKPQQVCGEIPQRMFPANHKVAVMVNNLGGSNQIECNIFVMEILKELVSVQLEVERVYAGHLMTSLDTFGFLVSLLDLTIDAKLLYFLDAPTAAPAWPKVFTASMVGFDKSNSFQHIVQTKYSQGFYGDDVAYVEPQGPEITKRSAQAFLIVINFACEALIACSEQINKMDEDSGDGDCGTTLARGANVVKTAIKEHKLTDGNPFVILRQLSFVIERSMGGLQGGLYSLFFEAAAKTFASYDNKATVTTHMWYSALVEANKAIAKFGKVKEGDRTMYDSLMAAQRRLHETLESKMHPILAFGEAVKAAEQRAMQTMFMTPCCGRASLMKCKTFKYPDPGAHAVGIWMRAAYEGVKLKFICECEQ